MTTQSPMLMFNVIGLEVTALTLVAPAPGATVDCDVAVVFAHVQLTPLVWLKVVVKPALFRVRLLSALWMTSQVVWPPPPLT